MKWTMWFFVSLSVVLLASCGEEPLPTEAELVKAANDVVATYRDRVEKQHAVYLEIGRLAAAVPVGSVSLDGLKSGPKLPRSRTHVDRQDIDLEYLEDHTIDPFRSPDFLRMGGTGWYQSPLLWLEGEWGEIFRDRTTARLMEFMTERFEEFFEPRYLFVYRTHQFREPRLVEEYDQPQKGIIGEKLVGAYEPGFVAGDVLIYEVATKRLLGGVSFTGKNSTQVDAARLKKDPGHLRTRLGWSAASQVEEALKPYVEDR